MNYQDEQYIRIWAKKLLEEVEEKFKDEKELKIRIAKQFGFLKARLEIVLGHPEDIEFVARIELEKEGEEK